MVQCYMKTGPGIPTQRLFITTLSPSIDQETDQQTGLGTPETDPQAEVVQTRETIILLVLEVEGDKIVVTII